VGDEYFHGKMNLGHKVLPKYQKDANVAACYDNGTQVREIPLFIGHTD